MASPIKVTVGPATKLNFKKSMSEWFSQWLNADTQTERYQNEATISLSRLLPFVFLHVGCAATWWVGVSPIGIFTAIALYWLRMLAITGVYHRYFSHRSYQLNRFWQALFAFWGGLAVQRGALWWASHHRKHHRHSDTPQDIHSPRQKGLAWAHLGWMCCDGHMQTDYNEVRDFSRYPELVWLNRYDWVPPLALAMGLYGTGTICQILKPEWGTSGSQLLVWGWFVSTVVLFHGTVTINSLAHVWGKRRFITDDDSRNNGLLAIITLGEGWHNNHHFYPGAARQGFYWWELDLTYVFLKLCSWLGIVRQLNPVPTWVFTHAKGELPSA